MLEFIHLEPRARKNSPAKILHTTCLEKRAVRPVPYDCTYPYGCTAKKKFEILFQNSAEITSKNVLKKSAIKTANSALENIPFALLKLLKLNNDSSLVFVPLKPAKFSFSLIFFLWKWNHFKPLPSSSSCSLLSQKSLLWKWTKKNRFASPQAFFVHGNFLFQSNGLD